MIFHDAKNDIEDIEILTFFNFLKMKKYDYTKDIKKLAKAFGNYYYCYCRDNGYICQDLTHIGCPMPIWVGEYYA